MSDIVLPVSRSHVYAICFDTDSGPRWLSSINADGNSFLCFGFHRQLDHALALPGTFAEDVFRLVLVDGSIPGCYLVAHPVFEVD